MTNLTALVVFDFLYNAIHVIATLYIVYRVVTALRAGTANHKTIIESFLISLTVNVTAPWVSAILTRAIKFILESKLLATEFLLYMLK